MSSYFVGCSKICVESILFLFFFFCSIPTIYVNNVHSFRMFNNNVTAVSVIYSLPKTRFYLFSYIKIIEDRDFSCILLYYVCFFRSNKSNIVFYSVTYLFVIYINILVCRVKKVAKHTNCTSFFFKDELWSFLSFLYFCYSILPSSIQKFHLCIEFCNSFSLCNCTNNYPKIFWANALYKLL